MKETEKDITLKEFIKAKEELRQRIRKDITNAITDFNEKTGIWIYDSKVEFANGLAPEVYLNTMV